MPIDETQRRAQETWAQFCEDLKQAGSQLIREDLPLDEIDAAEGLRYLSRLLRSGLERHVEGADAANPYLHSLCDERIKGFGGDNPDTLYFGAAISSDYTYRLEGDFRRCSYFTVMTNGLDEHGGYTITGNLDGDSIPGVGDAPISITIGRAGSAIASGQGALLTTDRQTQSLLLRCTFEGPLDKEVPGLALARVDASGEIVHCQLEPTSAGLADTARFVHESAQRWCSQSTGLRKNLNQLTMRDPEHVRKMGGDPSIFYYGAAWSLEADEFLIIHIPTIPPCTTWGFQLNNLWTESLDYTQAPIHLNKHTARADADGGVTIIVSEEDPDHPNWLRTLGHRSGTANLRLMGASEPLVAHTRIAKATELAGGGRDVPARSIGRSRT